MSTTLNQKNGVLPWLMLTGMPSARRCQGVGSVWNQHPSRITESTCLDRLHIMIQENSRRSENGSCVSSSSSDENNVGNDALFVIGPH